MKERISAVGSSAPRITITNRGGWVGVDAAERQFVEAEIVATQDEFIAVFETQPGVDDAPLGILCGPVRILPKSVLKVVAMRTTTAAGIIAGKKKLFKGRMKPVYFAEARCDRNVCVAVAGPLGGSTMTKGMVDVLCSPRVRFAQAWTTATGEKQAYEFFLDDTVHPAEHNFDARPTCYDTNSVFAFDTERKPTPDVRRMLALGFVQAALGGSATTATKWLVDQRSVRTLRGTGTAIGALTAPPVLSTKYGPLAARFFGQLHGVHRASPGTTHDPAAFELCAGQHGVLSPNVVSARCCCGFVQNGTAQMRSYHRNVLARRKLGRCLCARIAPCECPTGCSCEDC